tara:strand:- start:26 stop:418 length:393 start_codon:yes stop_codon:yes gene_type:complete
MSIIVKNIKWIMLFAGVVTCTTFFAVVNPQDALLTMFGSNLEEPLANLITRSWGFLIFLMGALLIFGAFNPVFRMFCIITVAISKIGFLFLSLIYGFNYIGTLWMTLLFDSLVVLTLAIYIISQKNYDEN